MKTAFMGMGEIPTSISISGLSRRALLEIFPGDVVTILHFNW